MNPIDEELLEVAIEKADEQEDERAADAFRSMFKMERLTPKQRAWAEAMVEGRRYDPAPEYENLISSGKAPRGREVELMVKDKPKFPPGRHK